MEDLRSTAGQSRDAVYAGDFVALGQAMIENTEAQMRLHPDLVSADAHAVIEIARREGALGWKVNGAGGDGGSLTLLLGADSSQSRHLIEQVGDANPLFQNIPVYLSRFGLRVWETS
jgi:D-glycero-alpha-D-manno-heptose-7-phosphate kinase